MMTLGSVAVSSVRWETQAGEWSPWGGDPEDRRRREVDELIVNGRWCGWVEVYGTWLELYAARLAQPNAPTEDETPFEKFWSMPLRERPNVVAEDTPWEPDQVRAYARTLLMMTVAVESMGGAIRSNLAANLFEQEGLRELSISRSAFSTKMFQIHLAASEWLELSVTSEWLNRFSRTIEEVSYVWEEGRGVDGGAAELLLRMYGPECERYLS